MIAIKIFPSELELGLLSHSIVVIDMFAHFAYDVYAKLVMHRLPRIMSSFTFLHIFRFIPSFALMVTIEAPIFLHVVLCLPISRQQRLVYLQRISFGLAGPKKQQACCAQCQH